MVNKDNENDRNTDYWVMSHWEQQRQVGDAESRTMREWRIIFGLARNVIQITKYRYTSQIYLLKRIELLKSYKRREIHILMKTMDMKCKHNTAVIKI